MQQGGLKLRQHFEGPLNKYTNVMKGWQYRWLVLNPDKGILEYHVSEAEMKVQKQPRGALHLAGAVISPSEEDSHTFVVNSASGDVYKLRAVDAKERQEWITRLRVVAELHSQALAQTNSPLVSREHGSSSAKMVPTNLSILDAFAHVQEWLQKAENCCQDLGNNVDRYPISGSGHKSTDPELLLLKATSQSTLGCLEECLYALQLQQRASVKTETVSREPTTTRETPLVLPHFNPQQNPMHHQHSQQQLTIGNNANTNWPTSYSSPASTTSTPIGPNTSTFGSFQKPSSSGSNGGNGNSNSGNNLNDSNNSSKIYGSNASLGQSK